MMGHLCKLEERVGWKTKVSCLPKFLHDSFPEVGSLLLCVCMCCWRLRLLCLVGQNLTIKRKRTLLSVFKLLKLVGGICVCMASYRPQKFLITFQVCPTFLCFLCLAYFLTRVNSLSLFMSYFSSRPRPAYD